MSKGLTIALVLVVAIGAYFLLQGPDGKLESPAEITLASANFAEPQILTEMVRMLIEANTELKVNHKKNFQGSTVLHSALQSGDVDGYVSWTGTQFTGVLGQEVTEEWKDRDKVLKFVQKEFQDRFQATWFEPFGFNNTYALAIRKETAEKNGVKTTSDVVPLANQLVLGTDKTFQEREGDGYNEFADTYGLKFKNVVAMDYGLLYRAVATRDLDAAIAYSTDGRIPALDLVILEDDKHFFPPYDASFVLRNDTLKQHPEIRSAIKPLFGSIDEKQMQKLNQEVDVNEQDPPEVARAYLKERGLL